MFVDTLTYHKDMETRLQSLWSKSAVRADSVEDFCNRFYRMDRFAGRGEEYKAIVLASQREDLAKNGFCCISCHDSCTGLSVAWFGGK